MNMKPVAATVLLLLLLTAGWPGPVYSQDNADPMDAPWGPWQEGPVVEGLPSGDDSRRVRVHVTAELEEQAAGARDVPVMFTLDVAEALREAGWPVHGNGELKGFQLGFDGEDPQQNPFTLVEVNPDTGDPIRTRVPLLVFPGSLQSSQAYDPRTNPVVTLQWVLDDETDGPRHYHVYFDAEHHGERRPPEYDPAQLGRVASAIGPGRGTDVYVPLPRESAGQELRITNLHGGDVQVRIFAYDRWGQRDPTSLEDFTLQTDVTQLVPHPTSEGGFLHVQATGFIAVEASSQGQSTMFRAGTAALFLPSVDGGFVGTRFVETPATNDRWFIYCSPLGLEVQERCTGEANGDAFNIRRSDYHEVDVTAGQVTQVTMINGVVAVQRVESRGAHDSDRRVPAPWPALDGPLAASSFAGHTLRENPRERLLLSAEETGARVEIQSLVGAGQILNRNNQDAPRGLWTLFPNQELFGVGWRQFNDHEDGPVQIRDRQGVGGLSVVNGNIPLGGQGLPDLSAIVPLIPRHHGLEYTFPVTADSTGNALGRLVLFIPHDGTTVHVAVTSGLDGTGTERMHSFRGLERHRVVDMAQDWIDNPGLWTVHADRPILAAWVKEGSRPAAAIAPAVTDLADVNVVRTQFAAPSIDLWVDQPFRTVQPGTFVDFQVNVRNLGRTVGMDGLADAVTLSVNPPSGWPAESVSLVPPRLELEPGGEGTALMRVQVPARVDVATGGVNIRLAGTSETEPGLRVEAGLRIDYQIHRGVLMQALGEDGFHSEVTARVGEGETVTYEVRVMNTGGIADRYNLRATPPAPEEPWTFEVVCPAHDEHGEDKAVCPTEATGFEGQTPFVAPHEHVTYFVTVGALEGAQRLPTDLRAVSASNPSIVDGARLVTTLDVDRDFRVEVGDPVRVIEGGNTTRFLVNLTNLAEVDEELVVVPEAPFPPGWDPPVVHVIMAGMDDPSPLDGFVDNETKRPHVPIPALQQVQLHVDVTVPNEAPPLQMALTRLLMRSNLDPAASDHATELRVLAARTSDLKLGLEGAPPVSVLPGVPSTFTLTLESRGNVPQNVTLVPTMLGSVSGWRFTDSHDRDSPWRIDVPPGERIDVPVTVVPPTSAPPTTREPSVVEFQARVEGAAAETLRFPFAIPEHPAVTLEPPALIAPSGHPVQLHLPIQNIGNMPLELSTSFSALSEWEVTAAPLDLAIEAQGTLALNVRAPPGTSEPLATTIRLHDEAQGGVLLEREIRIQVGLPELRTELVDTNHLPDSDQVVHLVRVHNDGEHSAYSVSVELMKDSQVLDQMRFDQVLPGASHVATLVGPRDTTQLALRISAAHDPQGTVQPLEGPDLTEESIPGLPALVPVAVLALAAFVWTKRRRERPSC